MFNCCILVYNCASDFHFALELNKTCIYLPNNLMIFIRIFTVKIFFLTFYPTEYNNRYKKRFPICHHKSVPTEKACIPATSLF